MTEKMTETRKRFNRIYDHLDKAASLGADAMDPVPVLCLTYALRELVVLVDALWPRDICGDEFCEDEVR